MNRRDKEKQIEDKSPAPGEILTKDRQIGRTAFYPLYNVTWNNERGVQKLHSTEVGLVLHTPQPWVRFSAKKQTFFYVAEIYQEKQDRGKWTDA